MATDTSNGNPYPANTSGLNATQIQGINVSATAPTSGQALVYSGTQYVPATPSGGGDLVKIATVTLATGANAITFSSIPSTYSMLELRGNVRCNTDMKYLGVRYNGDTTNGNYYFERYPNTSGTVTSGTGSEFVIAEGALNSTYDPFTGFFLPVFMDIYSPSASFPKAALVEARYAKGDFKKQLCAWNSSAAISSLSLYVQDGTSLLAVGSTLSLYARK